MKRILAIETSCDETAVAIAEFGEDSFTLKGEGISSQIAVHEAYGGVVPEIASREHLKALPLLVDNVLREAGTGLETIDGVAVTRGPGLKGCLLIGYNFAKAVAVARSIPFIGVNHIEGHAIAPLLDHPQLRFPFIVLIVSGGHTELHSAHSFGHYELIARTSDDAAGEAFDKSAAIMGFTYPGGPALAKLADTVTSSRFTLPKVMRERPGFSFSGLKNAISLLIKREGNNPDLRAELAHAIQESIVDALMFKLAEAARSHTLPIVVSGGVAANSLLRARVRKEFGDRVFFPSMRHCTDNAAMIALAASCRLRRGEDDPLSSDVLSRWPLEEMT